MKNIKIQYRPIVAILLLASVPVYTVYRIIRFLLDGYLPDRSIDVDIQDFNGEVRKVYTDKDGEKYVGEYLVPIRNTDFIPDGDYPD